MTAAVAGAVRGRPSAADLTESLRLARGVNANLRTELRAQLLESRDFASEVRAHALRVHMAAQSDRIDIAAHEAAAIVEAADRHLRQRGAA